VINSRRKGARAELEVAEILSRMGIESRRAQQYCGRAGTADIQCDAPLHVEVKHQERLSPYAYMDQAVRDCKPASSRIPIVWMRSNQRPWLVVVRADDVLRFVEVMYAARIPLRSDCQPEI
jgi:hypothetical protein